MDSIHRLRPRRAEGEETPRYLPEEVTPGRTPLGICHTCAAIVYSGDTLAMAGGYLLHDGCCATAHPGKGAA